MPVGEDDEDVDTSGYDDDDTDDAEVFSRYPFVAGHSQKRAGRMEENDGVVAKRFALGGGAAGAHKPKAKRTRKIVENRQRKPPSKTSRRTQKPIPKKAAKQATNWKEKKKNTRSRATRRPAPGSGKGRKGAVR